MRSRLTIASLLISTSLLALDREEAREFLYSTLSLPDRADYSADFYMQNIDASLKAREEMPWGMTVPDREFKHFVLPVRVNNENLDRSRIVFYEQLRSRVQDLSMRDAVLEVNHWCHENVSYRPSDARTSSPLSTQSQAIGRCGEESTFTVAALRAVGIPARQIYTPRWAHTDDNHAWVEVWVDGDWYFLGACEPEPVLNLAWFNAPSTRGLLMSTNVAGRYDGPEEVLHSDPLYTRINVTSNYAPVDTLQVRVTDGRGNIVPEARVDFCIYNYAEYYQAVTRTADSEGRASMIGGLGDIVVWATDGHSFGVAKGNPADYHSQAHPLEVRLDRDESWSGSWDFNIEPPAQGHNSPGVSEEMRFANDRRLQYEDSVRNAYIATFITPLQADSLAGALGVDSAVLTRLLTLSRGNHSQLAAAIESLTPTMRPAALALLANISEKDLRDIPAEVVTDAVRYAVAPGTMSRELYDKYVLSPRIENEGLRPWREPLHAEFSDRSEQFREDPEALARWISTNIQDASAENPMGLRMSPLAVLAEMKGDPVSRSIFFVAVARSLGIPSRIDPVTGRTQYMDAQRGRWITVDLTPCQKTISQEGSAPEAAPRREGKLRLAFTPEGHLVDPKYFSQFSISRIEDGVPRLLDYPEATTAAWFDKGRPLEEGTYILTTGQRLASGGVLARSEVFHIAPGKTTVLPLVIRQDSREYSVIGSLNAEHLYIPLKSDSQSVALPGDAPRSLLSTTGRGYYVLALIEPGNEPSSHLLNDISAVADQLQATGRRIMLLFDTEEKMKRFRRELFGVLPENVVFGIDADGAIRRELEDSLHMKSPAAPLVVVADTFNRVVWESSGYTIGLGDQLLQVLSAVKE